MIDGLWDQSSPQMEFLSYKWGTSLLSMDQWTAVKKHLSHYGSATSSWSDSKATCSERKSHLRLMIRVLMRWYRRLCTDHLVFALQVRKTRKTSARRSSVEDCATSCRLKWGQTFPVLILLYVTIFLCVLMSNLRTLMVFRPRYYYGYRR